MGNFLSRRNSGVQELEYSSQNAYRYPPRSGCYFGSHFIMGGQRFETAQPEAYLFGDNHDLNWLHSRPYPFPYPGPCTNEATKTLKSLVNIRKDTLRLVKTSENTQAVLPGEETQPNSGYNLEFTFDSDVRVAITIYYFATEEISNGQAIYQPRDPSTTSETFHYKRGTNQQFSQSTHIFDPSKYPEEDVSDRWQYNPDKEVFPIVIQCNVEDDQESVGHSHITFAIAETNGDDYVIKALKQKQVVDGLCFLLQEIFGIENKNSPDLKADSEEIEDTGSECVICMSDIRDTLILPCRHLCLCNTCADSLRYQSSTCPICRVPFRALLQIRAMRKKTNQLPSSNPGENDVENTSQENIPQGYEATSLMEALNGPSGNSRNQQNTQLMPPDGQNPNLDRLLGIGSAENGEVPEQRTSKRRSSTKSNRSIRSNQGVEAESSSQHPTDIKEGEKRQSFKGKRSSTSRRRERQSETNEENEINVEFKGVSVENNPTPSSASLQAHVTVMSDGVELDKVVVRDQEELPGTPCPSEKIISCTNDANNQKQT
ncbi:DgyrCDS11937 [Dimorphilus gyrociliatus]|uniref:RING-type E3 ubiquitin transferase n=1 Tax=Dimorphilus gyrociliatus TaxID=2664684 RepID=A0A7I8W7G0_9ANNE|nr:DgyrCDS11937 [Dimorphilus gyrociliatus]